MKGASQVKKLVLASTAKFIPLISWRKNKVLKWTKSGLEGILFLEGTQWRVEPLFGWLGLTAKSGQVSHNQPKRPFQTSLKKITFTTVRWNNNVGKISEYPWFFPNWILIMLRSIFGQMHFLKHFANCFVRSENNSKMNKTLEKCKICTAKLIWVLF